MGALHIAYCIVHKRHYDICTNPLHYLFPLSFAKPLAILHDFWQNGMVLTPSMPKQLDDLRGRPLVNVW